jgi:hypothetical protein
MLICAGLLVMGGFLSWLTIRNGPVVARADEQVPAPVPSSPQLECPTRGH